MPKPDELLKVVRQWIERAEDDLRAADYTLTLKEECPFATVCFHAQQCVEKYLKALLKCWRWSLPRSDQRCRLKSKND